MAVLQREHGAGAKEARRAWQDRDATATAAAAAAAAARQPTSTHGAAPC